MTGQDATTVQAGGRHLRVVLRHGPGRPLLLMNGIGASLEMWRPLERALDGMATIAFDAPGAGRSELPVRPLRMRGLARVVAELLDGLGVERVDVLGYSFGGALAQQFAHDHAPRVGSLILAATTAGAVSLPGSPRAMLDMLSPARYRSLEHMNRSVPRIAGGRIAREPELLRRHAADRLVVPPSVVGYTWQMWAITGWTSVPWLTSLRPPTLVLAGDDDRLVPLWNARFLARAIPDARLHVVPGAGHLLLIDQPEDIAPVIGEFLTSRRS